MEQNNDDIDYKKAYEYQGSVVKQFEESLEKSNSKIESLELELKQLRKLIFLGKHERFVSSKTQCFSESLALST